MKDVLVIETQRDLWEPQHTLVAGRVHDCLYEVEVKKVRMQDRFTIYNGDERILDTTIQAIGQSFDSWPKDFDKNGEIEMKRLEGLYANYYPYFYQRFSLLHNVDEYKTYAEYFRCLKNELDAYRKAIGIRSM